VSILIDEETRLLVQGITGGEGSFHTQRCIEYGTRVVAGVTPGKGGSEMLGVPVFNEAADAGIPLVVCITEGIPVLDMVMVHNYLKNRSTRLIGPNCPGIISPGKCKVGLMVGDIHLQGNVGVVSRSGTLTYEVVAQLTSFGIGQSTCVGIGGDPLPGSTFVDILKLFQEDKDTKAVVLIGEIGGNMEQEAAQFIKEKMTKPVVAFVAGATAPPDKRMGHAGAIISGSSSRAKDKIAALANAGAVIAPSPAEIGLTVKEALGK